MITDEERVFFMRSKLRKEVLKELNKNPTIASILSKRMNLYRETISRVFSDLLDRGYVECSSPNSTNYRFYRITSKGKKVLKELENKDL